MYKCQYCNKNIVHKHTFVVHQKYDCTLNPSKIARPPSWRKGLTKFTDERILKNSLYLKEYFKNKPGAFSGKRHTRRSLNCTNFSYVKIFQKIPRKV
jgi:hypothetical protein